jgi:long-chain acyl-CoA synthetase
LFIDFLSGVFQEFGDQPWMIWKNTEYTYGSLAKQILVWDRTLDSHRVRPGDVVALTGDFSPESVAAFLALTERRCVIVPLTEAVAQKRDEFLSVARANVSIAFAGGDVHEITQLPGEPDHPLYEELRDRGHPGLVLFSSGSSGKSKAAVHDLVPMLKKFTLRKRRMRAIAFLLFDHIGGVNTMFYTLSNGGTLVVVPDRSPDSVLEAIERYAVELLPTSPTFINLILLSEAYRRHDLSSLTTVTYGTEPMPQTTLTRFAEIAPRVKMQQTYGLSELGILRSKSRDSRSTWVKIGGDGFQTRVVNGILQIRAASAMLGYLNADSPFTDDGWFDTGDLVTVDGEYMQVHGRRSELINVGGEKVHPSEVEGVIEGLPSIAEVTVYGEKNPIVGQMVCARVRKADDTPDGVVRRDIKRLCGERLARFKVPVRITFASAPQHSARFKKQRHQGDEPPTVS